MMNTNQSKLTPTFNRDTDKGDTMTWEQLQSNNNCYNKLTYKKIKEKHSFSTKYSQV